VRAAAQARMRTSKCSWPRRFGLTQVAMESSGVDWKPVWNILEGQFTVVLANAQHIKNVPARKTDQKDAEWIAQLLQYGLLRPTMYLAKSFAMYATWQGCGESVPRIFAYL
jgi:transposase